MADGCAEPDSYHRSLVSVMERMCQFMISLPPPTTYFSRKLKNRVAAQTARDRKKAKMGELEQQVLELELEVMKCSSYQCNTLSLSPTPLMCGVLHNSKMLSLVKSLITSTHPHLLFNC